MPADSARPSSRRRWWMGGACAALGIFLIGQKCMCPDPATLFSAQAAGLAEIRGTPFRAAAPAPEAAPAIASEPAPPAAASPAPAPSPDPPAASAAKPGTKAIEWTDIQGYSYVPPRPFTIDAAPTGEVVTDQIPEAIRAMSGTRITIEGYAVPLDFEQGVVKKFILLSSPLACCFAEAPPMNHWMAVTNDDENVEFETAKYAVHRVSGVFEVGEETRDGYVVGIYRLRAESIETVTE